ncbi:hypothetical protein SAMN05518801_11754 [Novosphingobium sp. CF614]|nr:hypothetical protein SAMN05518801_11754 [Novosphingobium sp. CF614]
MFWIGVAMLIGGIAWHLKGTSPAGKSGMSQANWLAVAGLFLAYFAAHSDVSDKCDRGNGEACMDLERMNDPNVR